MTRKLLLTTYAISRSKCAVSSRLMVQTGCAPLRFNWYSMGKEYTKPACQVCSQWGVQNSSMSAFVMLQPPPNLEDTQIACTTLASIVSSHSSAPIMLLDAVDRVDGVPAG